VRGDRSAIYLSVSPRPEQNNDRLFITMFVFGTVILERVAPPLENNAEKDENISALELQEKELMEQLESTRARLKKKMQSSASRAFIEAVLPEESIPYNARRIVKNIKEFDKNKEPAQMLPILTQSAQLPFEVGLQDDTAVPHTLPIFQLPKVSSESKIVNTLPKYMNEEEKRSKQEAIQEKERLKTVLGLTDQELEMFELNTSSDMIELMPSSDQVIRQSESKHTNQCETRIEKNSALAKAYANFPALSNKKRQSKTKSGKKETLVKLRKELQVSIQSVQSITSTVHEEIAELHRIYPVHSLKAQIYMRQWGLAKLENIFVRFNRRITTKGFTQWRKFNDSITLEEKRRLYQKFQGSNRLSKIELRIRLKQVSKAFFKWHADTEYQKMDENHRFEIQAAFRIQRFYRGHLGRNRFFKLQRYIRAQEQIKATTLLQAVFRGKEARLDTSVKQEQRKKGQAAVLLQTRCRQRLAKRRVIDKRKRLEEQARAALKVQTAWRCKKGQLSYHILKQAKRDAAATRMQAVQRRRTAVRKTKIMCDKHRKDKAVTLIQRNYRGRIGRRNMGERRKIVLEQRFKEELVALKLQSIYRGHRGRIMFQLRLQAKYALMEVESESISKVQSLFRGKLGRQKAVARKIEYRDEMCGWARSWVETFDDAKQMWSFVNQYTGESLVEPPPDGYVKRDGLLALLDGQVIEDPVVVARREQERNLVKCIECEEIAATRMCNECEDGYCDNCFEIIHVKGKLAQHSFEWYQEGLAPEPLEEEPLNASWEKYFDETSGFPYWYNSSTGETIWTDPYGAESSEWQQYYDESSGYPYWYNESTGTTSWEDPTIASSEWEEFFDAGSGAPYWYNNITGETSKYIFPSSFLN